MGDSGIVILALLAWFVLKRQPTKPPGEAWVGPVGGDLEEGGLAMEAMEVTAFAEKTVRDWRRRKPRLSFDRPDPGLLNGFGNGPNGNGPTPAAPRVPRRPVRIRTRRRTRRILDLPADGDRDMETLSPRLAGGSAPREM